MVSQAEEKLQENIKSLFVIDVCIQSCWLKSLCLYFQCQKAQTV